MEQYQVLTGGNHTSWLQVDLLLNQDRLIQVMQVITTAVVALEVVLKVMVVVMVMEELVHMDVLLLDTKFNKTV